MKRDIDGRRANLERYLVEWAKWVASWRPRIGNVSASFMFSSGGRGYDSAEEYLSSSDKWAMEMIDTSIEALNCMQRLIINVEFTNRAFGNVFHSARLPSDPNEYADILDGALFALVPIAMKKGLPL